MLFEVALGLQPAHIATVTVNFFGLAAPHAAPRTKWSGNREQPRCNDGESEKQHRLSNPHQCQHRAVDGRGDSGQCTRTDGPGPGLINVSDCLGEDARMCEKHWRAHPCLPR